jgi:hypothetical protein
MSANVVSKIKTGNIFFLAFIILFNYCSSQGHLAFDEIPINGNLNSFSRELVNIGFTEMPSFETGQIRLSGTFVNKNCEISVFGSPESNTVYKVVIKIPEESYDSVKSSYERLQEKCASKYGKGASKYQQFHNSPRFLFNEPKLVREPKPGDYTRYITPNGTVILEIRLDFISITYMDRRNNELRKREEGAGNKTLHNEY